MHTSTYIENLPESATLAISKKVRSLTAAGRDIVGLTLGEPDFDTPAHIREAAKAALDAGYTHYPPVAGLPELREAIVDKLLTDDGLHVQQNQVVVSTGAKQSLYNVMQAILNPGDEVVVPTPYWVTYTAQIYLARGVARAVETTVEQAYKMSAEQLDVALNERTRAVLFSTPSNPTGSAYTRDELAAWVEVLARYPDVYVIADEIYEELLFDGEHHSIGAFDAIADRTITVNGFSKAYAMTGWRLGYLAAPPQVAALCEKLQGQVTSGANSFAMKGAVSALTGPHEPIDEMREAFRRRRDATYEQLVKIPDLRVNLPEGAFYFYPDLGAYLGRKTPDGTPINTSEELCLYLLDSVGLALVPGEAFGTDRHVRISYAYAQDQLDEGVRRLAEGLGRLE